MQSFHKSNMFAAADPFAAAAMGYIDGVQTGYPELVPGTGDEFVAGAMNPGSILHESALLPDPLKGENRWPPGVDAKTGNAFFGSNTLGFSNAADTGRHPLSEGEAQEQRLRRFMLWWL